MILILATLSIGFILGAWWCAVGQADDAGTDWEAIAEFQRARADMEADKALILAHGLLEAIAQRDAARASLRIVVEGEERA